MVARDALILAIDQGTSATKAMLVDPLGQVVAVASVPIGQCHPAPGWAEQDPAEIWSSVCASVEACLAKTRPDRVAGVALSVQRETTVLWDLATGAALGPAVSWQDQRTAARVAQLERTGHAGAVRERTGLPLDPMFSALKARWLLDHHAPGPPSSCVVGTLDAWLLAQFSQRPVIERGNASRTQLLDLTTGAWDADLLELFGIPQEVLPDVVSSVGPFPSVRGLAPLLDGTPVLAVMADSHAALFAQAGWRSDVVKATFGTGSSIMSTGGQASADPRVCRTIAWDAGAPTHASEANIRSSGRTLTWLAKLFETDVPTLLAEAATAGSEGVSLVPAFGGLGAPWWDPNAQPVLSGFSLATGRQHVFRAAAESIVHQVDDVLTSFAPCSDAQLRCDGGLTASHWLMQLQADVSGWRVRVSEDTMLSALGAAYLAGLHIGWWTTDELEEFVRMRSSTVFEARLDGSARRVCRRQWRAAVGRSRDAEGRSGTRS